MGLFWLKNYGNGPLSLESYRHDESVDEDGVQTVSGRKAATRKGTPNQEGKYLFFCLTRDPSSTKLTAH